MDVDLIVPVTVKLDMPACLAQLAAMPAHERKAMAQILRNAMTARNDDGRKFLAALDRATH